MYYIKVMEQSVSAPAAAAEKYLLPPKLWYICMNYSTGGIKTAPDHPRQDNLLWGYFLHDTHNLMIQ